IGHICPKYILPSLTKDMIEQAINKTLPKPSFAVLDWKGLGKDKSRLIEILKELNIEIKRSDQLI
ncbi:MAG: hypothetical protein KJ601_07455, partial [Nanoarchaeota archaeon]|nr:hypothetical protein [Nanoarchaeota archaeon]MBU1705073.1 hypothetical protein [Nanoarchaeota archaeon]